MGFFQRLAETARRNDTLLCVGLDPTPETFSTEERAVPDRLFAFNRRIVDATRDLVCAYKLNSAFYEAEGPDGMESLARSIDYIRRDTPVILDVKRGDIGSTSAAYARSAFDVFGADAVTVSPYLGGDALAPFIERAEKGSFVLCHTSNPGAGELQELDCGGRPLYVRVAERVATWNTRGNLGLVVGATYPEALQSVRQAGPDLWVLLPGVGTQGGDLESSLSAALWQNGLGVVVNVSRAVCNAADPRAAALDLRERINRARAGREATQPISAMQAEKERLATVLADIGAVRFGHFTLKSGQVSPIYIDLRLLASFPRALDLAARAYARLLAPLNYDRIAAIPYAALPIGTAVSLLTDRPLIYPRKEVKGYGTGRQIEGVFAAGESAVVLDDLITTGASKLEAIEPLRAAGLSVRDIVVLIDREGGGGADLAAAGYRLHSVLTLTELLDALAARGRIQASERQVVVDWLRGGSG